MVRLVDALGNFFLNFMGFSTKLSKIKRWRFPFELPRRRRNPGSATNNLCLIYISLLSSENVSEEDRSNFLSLLELYSSIGQHENVVKFYGVCTVGG